MESNELLRMALEESSEADLMELVDSLPSRQVQELLAALPSAASSLPASPGEQAELLDDTYLTRPHLAYLSERLLKATQEVRAGTTRRLVISMPPRMGKSTLTSVYLPLWLLRLNPAWKIGLISHNSNLATGWGRKIRAIIEERGSELGIVLERDGGAAGQWNTTSGGGLVTRSAPGESITGLGFNILLMDDVVKDFATAHSALSRQSIWDWWVANAETRLEPPSLVITIGTRWHEDDFIGRLLSPEHEGDPAEWEVISFPALAEEHDVLGREPGEPLLSPLVRDETEEQAVARWEKIRASVGSYTWFGLYQQRPAPAAGAIFHTDWWRFWTLNPATAAEQGDRVRLVTEDDLRSGTWLDSWDTAFGATAAAQSTGSYVVGQRWVRAGADRFLVAQQRARLSFTETLEAMRRWSRSGDPVGSPFGELVHERLIEEAANGAAIIDTLRGEVSGLKPVKARVSKEARARAITPEVESGNVYLPHPSDPGNEWVADLLSELRNFPHDAHDDQVDALTQALSGLRDSGRSGITVPGRSGRVVGQNRSRTALAQVRRSRGPGGR